MQNPDAKGVFMKQRKHLLWAVTLLIVLTVSALAGRSPAAAADQPPEDRPVEDGMYKLICGIDPGYVWDISQASKEDGANLQLYKDNGSNAQKFLFTYAEDGYYTITNVNSEQAVGCFADELSDCVNLQQGSFAPAELQLWKLELRENGYYSLICKGNGLAADAASGTAQNGTNLQASGPNDTQTQEFRLLKTEKRKDGTQSQAAQHSKWFYYGLTFLLLGAEGVLVIGAASVFGRKRVQADDCSEKGSA